jgi:hypothetical protein
VSIAVTWGTRPEERARPFPCDELAPAGAVSLWRGTTVHAPAAAVFRWLCQLRAAPYSYDWIDNLGRRSPRELTPGLDRLEVGQRVMTIFELASFEAGRHLTLVMRRGAGERAFGRIWVTYEVVAEDSGTSRLLAKLRVVPGGGLRGVVLRHLLPWGDLVMMRKQLHTLARLAERSAAP